MSEGSERKKDPQDRPKDSARAGQKKVPVDPGPAANAALEEKGAGPDEAAEAAQPSAELAEKNLELTDGLMRLQAEFENYRKRMVKEQTRILETAEADLVRKLLPVIDNLDRAIANAPAGEAEGFRQGVQMVLTQMLEILEKEGLSVIDPEGEPFDPEHHEAMMVIETDDCPEDTVLEVVQKGYRFSGVLLRPAMVKVSCPVRG